MVLYNVAANELVEAIAEDELRQVAKIQQLTHKLAEPYQLLFLELLFVFPLSFPHFVVEYLLKSFDKNGLEFEFFLTTHHQHAYSLQLFDKFAVNADKVVFLHDLFNDLVG